MLMTVTKPPEDSFICRAASRACLSSGLITRGISHLVRVRVTGSILILQISPGSGTALTHTMIFMKASWLYPVERRSFEAAFESLGIR